MTNINPALLSQIEKLLAQHGGLADQNADLTVIELWDQWAPTVYSTARGPNIRAHRRFLGMECSHGGVTFKLGEMKWSALKPAHLNAWRAALAKWIGVRGKLLSEGYRDQVRLTLQACFTFHLKTETISRNPLQGIAREQSVPATRRGYFTPEQFEFFTAHCRPALAAIMKLSFTCAGMRRDEARTLKKNQIDFDGKVCTVRNKGGGKKRILLTDEAIEMLRGWVATAPSDTVFWNPNDPLGGPVPKGTLWRWVESARKTTGLMLGDERPTIHHTRHSWTRAMMRKGAPETWIASQLGHRDTKMIARVYGPLDGLEAEARMREMMNAPAADAAPAKPNPWACPTCKVVYDDPRALVACMDDHAEEQNPSASPRVPAARKPPAPYEAPRAAARKITPAPSTGMKKRYATK